MDILIELDIFYKFNVCKYAKRYEVPLLGGCYYCGCGKVVQNKRRYYHNGSPTHIKFINKIIYQYNRGRIHNIQITKNRKGKWVFVY